MTKEQIQKLAEDKYPLPPIEGWQPDYDVYKNDREKWVEGYKAAILQNKGEWISVKTNLPKEGVRVLMLCSSKHIEVGYFYREWMSNSSFTSMDERGYNVTNWQPLPAPPEQTVT